MNSFVENLKVMVIVEGLEGACHSINILLDEEKITSIDDLTSAMGELISYYAD